MNTLENLPNSFSPCDMADFLGISKSFAYKIVNKGELNFYSIGRRKIILKDDFIKWLEKNKHSI